ncbi:hypothetical protein MUO14_16970 [Halobacillus shinanisalinarum]|uniref:Uncharacterized protein n=1 Tax=Halobacillus shinanisalinarum TaxID=2932258 RepID=A0ABY4GVH0_9BACI|nr:hypothetical protein [Halobacillus shinanisalinarum]UOQ92170.1 hypothetical protein MUO14_16970 [Halobacillus shinanisalinarum]
MMEKLFGVLSPWLANYLMVNTSIDDQRSGSTAETIAEMIEMAGYKNIPNDNKPGPPCGKLSREIK